MDKELKIKVKVGSQPLKDFNAEIRKAKEELAKLDLQGKRNSKEYKEQAQYLKTLNKEYDRLQQNTKEAGRGAETSSRNFTELTAKIGAATVAVYAVVASFQKLFSIAQQGANLKNLRESFRGTAEDLAMLRKATAGTVTESGLIALSNQAADLGLSLQEQAKLFALAEEAGDKYGGSLEQNFERVVNATDGSAKGLRAVGVGVKEYQQKLDELAKSQGVKLEQLSAEEQLQLRLQAIFELTGTTMDSVNSKTVDAADKLEQLSLVLPTVSEGLGVGLVEGFTEASKSADDFSISLEDVSSVAQALGKDIGRFTSNIVNDLADLVSKAADYTKDFFESTMSEELKNQRRVDLRLEALENEYIAKNQYGPFATEEQIREARRKQRLLEMPGRDITRTGTRTRTADKEKTILTEAAKVQAELVSLEAERVQLISEGYDQTKAYYDLLIKISAKEAERKQLTGYAIPVTAGVAGQELVTGLPAFANEIVYNPKIMAESVSVMEASKVVYDNVTKTLNTLGIATDNFVGTLINGFNTVLSIMESVKAVNAILNFIPFLATGGTMHSAGLAVVGERGPELVQLPAGARVYNNADTNRLMNSGLGAQSVNVYVNASPNANWINTSIPKYFDKRNYKRIN